MVVFEFNSLVWFLQKEIKPDGWKMGRKVKEGERERERFPAWKRNLARAMLIRPFFLLCD